MKAPATQAPATPERFDVLDYLDDLVRCACCDWNRVSRQGEVCAECREDAR